MNVWSLIPLVVAIAINSLIALAIYMWREAMRETRAKDRIQAELSGEPSVRTQIVSLTKLIDTQNATIDKIHHDASEMTNTLVKQVGGYQLDAQRQITRIVDVDIRELRERLNRIEEGQTERTRTLRHRSHTIAGFLNALVMRMTYYERGEKPPRPPEPFEFDAADLGEKG